MNLKAPQKTKNLIIFYFNNHPDMKHDMKLIAEHFKISVNTVSSIISEHMRNVKNIGLEGELIARMSLEYLEADYSKTTRFQMHDMRKKLLNKIKSILKESDNTSKPQALSFGP